MTTKCTLFALAAFLITSQNTFAHETFFFCIGSWESCRETGVESVSVKQPEDACEQLYKKSSADLIHSVKCAHIGAAGETGEFFEVNKRCD